MAALKISFLRKLGPKRLRTVELQDPEAGEIALEIEEAAQRFFDTAPSVFDDGDFRSQFFIAIDSLPDDERQVVCLLLKGLPIDSKEASGHRRQNVELHGENSAQSS